MNPWRSWARRAMATASALCIGLMGFTTGAHADPLRIVWQFPAGGDGDGILRLMAEYWSADIGNPVVVENRTGAGGLISMQAVMASPADGKTLLGTAMGAMALLPHTRKLPVNPVESFVPVCQFAETSGYIFTGKHLGFKSYNDFVEHARKNPGKLSYASSGIGTQVHLLAEMLQRSLNIQLLHVPYKGPPEAVNDMIGGRLDIMFEAYALPFALSGKMDILATFSDKPPANLPTIPARKELGFEGMPKSWFALFARRETPPQEVAQLEKGCARVLANPEFQTRVKKFQAQAIYKSSAELGNAWRTDYKTQGDLLRSLKLKLDN